MRFYNPTTGDNTIKVLWKKLDNTLQEILSITGNYASPIIETFDTGEVYAFVMNGLSPGGINIYRWPDVTKSIIPLSTFISGAGTWNGKFTTYADEQRRCIYYIGTSGYFFCFDEAGLEIYRQYLLNIANDPHYPIMAMDQGKLYIIYCTGRVTTAAYYINMAAVMSPNPRDYPNQVWMRGPWGAAGSAATILPFDSESGEPGSNPVWLSSGEQNRLFSTLPVSALFHDNHLEVLYANCAYREIRPFSHDDLRQLTMGLTMVPWTGVEAGYNAINFRPLRSSGIFPRAFSGAYVLRGEKRYVIAHDNDLNVVALESSDGGKSFHDFATVAVPVINSPQGNLLHYVSSFRGDQNDSDIIGVVESVNVTPSAWSVSSIEEAATFPVDLYSWRLEL